MSEIMKVGGKSPSNTTVGMAVDNNGKVLVKRVWETEIVDVANFSPRDTAAVTYPAGDAVNLEGYGIIGLRIINSTDQPLNITLTDGSNYLATLDVATLTIQVPNNGRSTMITSDDVPCLNILQSVKFKCQFSTAPTQGFVNIKVIKKR